MTTDNFYLQQIARALGGTPPAGGQASETTLQKVPGLVSLVNTSSPEWGGASFTVPATEYWKLVSAYCACTTNATVGNRRVVISCSKGSDIVGLFPACVDQPASVVRFYNFMVGVVADDVPWAGQYFRCQLPGDLWLPPSTVIFIGENNGISGTTISSQSLVVQRYKV